MKIKFFEATYQGARSSNQDYFMHIVTDDWACFVVADGLGGHYRGDIASSVYTQAFIKSASNNAPEILSDPINGLGHAMLQAWEAMREQVKDEYGAIDSQTTFVAVWLDERHFLTAHVGDSRIYLLNHDEIVWRTPDHTPVQALFEQGEISEEEFYYHPQQNRLLRTINLFEPPEAEIYLRPPLQKSDTVLLCSDGFWNPLSRNDILLLGKTDDLQETTTKLVDAILADHPTDADNITVQLLRKTS